MKPANLYGTTPQGGNVNSPSECGPLGCGVVFKLDPSRKETVLYNFCSQPNCTDGAVPFAGVIRDEAGNLYGTTWQGGSHDSGVVFKLDPSGKETVLYNFCSQPTCPDGSEPYAGVIRDEAGNLYGSTTYAGSGEGVVFKLDPSGEYTVLHAFPSFAFPTTDGQDPYASLVRDKEGNLYGTTVVGGSTRNGVAFKVDPSGEETVLYTFCSQTDCADGSNPQGGVIRDEAGNLYGTNSSGAYRCSSDFPAGCGVVFKLDPSGKETVLYTFTGKHGAAPLGGLTLGDDGSLYGTTTQGGYRSASYLYGYGVVFKLDPSGKETVLHAFNGTWEGRGPASEVLLMHNDSLSSTSLYGTTAGGGARNAGVIFKITLTATE